MKVKSAHFPEAPAPRPPFMASVKWELWEGEHMGGASRVSEGKWPEHLSEPD